MVKYNMTTFDKYDAGPTDAIEPGKMQRFSVNGKALLVCNVDGNFYCVDDVCTHEDASLYLGCLKGNEVQCSLHGGRFNVITGEATIEPAEIALQTYTVEITHNKIYIQVN